jgi:threonine aldolase
VGSVLLGTEGFIKRSRRIRKAFGGGMRQAGYLAAAGMYALQHHVPRLQQDHDHAKQLATALQEAPFVASLLPVETNIIIFNVNAPYTAAEVVARFKEQQLLAYAIAPMQVRMVVHLDVTPEMIDRSIAIFKNI